MVLVLVLYLVGVWLVFSKLKLVRWNWGSGTVAVGIGVFILAVFSALLNNLAPSGSFVVTGRVVEVAPNVSGQVTAILVQPNVQVKAGTVLLQLDAVPFTHKVKQLEASLAQAEQQARQLRAAYDQASASIQGLTAQLAYSRKRLTDLQTLTSRQATSEFREQDAQIQLDSVNAQLQSARAVQASAKIALDAEIEGENPTVAQFRAQLESAKWELEQTTVRAPSDGYVTTMALSPGDRASPTRSVMSFIVASELHVLGMFAPNGFQAIKPGAEVALVFDFQPGQTYRAKVAYIPLGVGQGQIAVSGTLARSGSVEGVKAFPAIIAMPEDIDRSQLRLGMPGSARAFSENAGVIGTLGKILIWVSSYTAYL